MYIFPLLSKFHKLIAFQHSVFPFFELFLSLLGFFAFQKSQTTIQLSTNRKFTITKRPCRVNLSRVSEEGLFAIDEEAKCLEIESLSCDCSCLGLTISRSIFIQNPFHLLIITVDYATRLRHFNSKRVIFAFHRKGLPQLQRV